MCPWTELSEDRCDRTPFQISLMRINNSNRSSVDVYQLCCLVGRVGPRMIFFTWVRICQREGANFAGKREGNQTVHCNIEGECGTAVWMWCTGG